MSVGQQVCPLAINPFSRSELSIHQEMMEVVTDFVGSPLVTFGGFFADRRDFGR